MGPLNLVLRRFRNVLIRVNEGAVKLLTREETVQRPDSVCEQSHWLSAMDVFMYFLYKMTSKSTQVSKLVHQFARIQCCVVCCVTPLSASLTGFSPRLTFAAGVALFWLRVHWSLHIWNDHKGEKHWLVRYKLTFNEQRRCRFSGRLIYTVITWTFKTHVSLNQSLVLPLTW